MEIGMSNSKTRFWNAWAGVTSGVYKKEKMSIAKKEHAFIIKQVVKTCFLLNVYCIIVRYYRYK